MKTTRRLSVSASYVWEVQNISFLYYCDVIEMIVRTHTKNNKIEQEQEVNSFFTAMNQQTSSYFHSS